MKKKVEYKIKSIKPARAFVKKTLAAYNLSRTVIEKAQIITEEILVNIIYQSDYKTTNDRSFITVKVTCSGSKIINLEFTDSGKPFNPTEYDFELEKRKVGGMGIRIVRSLSKNMIYKRINNQNILNITLM
jgi:anti-sigma regulatory factor (Ser/Thr protein kinase)